MHARRHQTSPTRCTRTPQILPLAPCCTMKMPSAASCAPSHTNLTSCLRFRGGTQRTSASCWLWCTTLSTCGGCISWAATVRTDHAALEWFNTQPKLSQRQARWSIAMQEHKVTFKYLPGRVKCCGRCTQPQARLAGCHCHV